VPGRRKRRKKYGRNSSDEQMRMATIQSQVGAVEKWDREHGGTPREEDWYIDEGWSGFVLARPSLDRLRRDMRDPERDWDELLIYDTSRLSRDPLHRLAILEPEAKRVGVTIIYVASPLFEDTPSGRFMAWQQAGMDRWFAETARDNMRRGLDYHVAKGLRWHAAYGYEILTVTVEGEKRPLRMVKLKEPEASVVRDIFRLVLDDWTARAVADWLNARGTPAPNGGAWTPTLVRSRIHCPWYSGKAPWGRYSYVEPARKRDTTPQYRRYEKVSRLERPQDQWVGVLDVPALVTPEEQERAKACLSRHRSTNARTTRWPYQLKNLVRCMMPLPDGSGTCGNSMCAHTRTYRSGNQRGYYHCGRQYFPPAPNGRRTCGTTVAVDRIEPLVWEHVSAALCNTGELRDAYERLRAQPDGERRQWEDALTHLHQLREEARQQLRRVRELYEKGRYDDDDFSERSGEIKPKIAGYDEQIEHAQAELAKVRSVRIDWESLERLAGRLGRLCQDASPEQRAEVMHLLLRRVEVWPDRYEIVLGLEEHDILTRTEPRHELIGGRVSSPWPRAGASPAAAAATGSTSATETMPGSPTRGTGRSSRCH
jgi:site-specific DNA recombinase